MSNLNPEQWQELSPYLDQALTLSGEERARWLTDLRAKDAMLAEQIQGLLDDHRQANREGFWKPTRRSPFNRTVLLEILSAPTACSP